MGLNTNLTVCNDGLGELERYPEEFVAQIRDHLLGGGSFGVGRHGNIVHMQPSEHADVTQLIACGGNFSTRLYCGRQTEWHHTDEGQVSILKAWARQLGYTLTPIREHSKQQRES